MGSMQPGFPPPRKSPSSQNSKLFSFSGTICEQSFAQPVTVVGKQVIEKFIRKHANSRASLSAWLDDAEASEWKTSQDIKNRYRTADFLSGNRVVFDIGGNNYRLVVLVRYHQGVLLIQKVGTHAEYSKWKLS